MDFMKLLGTVIAVLFHPASSSKINGKRNREETKWCFITRLLKNPQSFDSEFLVKPRTETSSPTLNLFLFLLRPQLRCAAENTFQFGAFDVYDFRWWWWWGRKNNPKRFVFFAVAMWHCSWEATGAWCSGNRVISGVCDVGRSTMSSCALCSAVRELRVWEALFTIKTGIGQFLTNSYLLFNSL